MKILVTGSTGFLGRCLTRKLVKSYDVRCLVRKTSNTSMLPTECEIVVGDFMDKESLEKAIENVDIIIHAAGSLGSSMDAYKINYDGTKNIIELASRVKKFIFVSSFMASEMLGLYGFSKLHAEHLLSLYPNTYIVRPGLMYGKNDRLISSILNHRFVIGDGKYEIQPTFVEDVADAIIALINYDGKLRMFEISGKSIIYNEFIDKILKANNKENIRIHIPMFICYLLSPIMHISIESLKTLTMKRNIDTEKSLNELGIKLTPLDGGLRKSLVMP